MAKTRIHGELRVVEDSPEIWVKLDDVLDWLLELPASANHPVAADVVAEIRQMLIDCVGEADLGPSDG